MEDRFSNDERALQEMDVNRNYANPGLYQSLKPQRELSDEHSLKTCVPPGGYYSRPNPHFYHGVSYGGTHSRGNKENAGELSNSKVRSLPYDHHGRSSFTYRRHVDQEEQPRRSLKKSSFSKRANHHQNGPELMRPFNFGSPESPIGRPSIFKQESRCELTHGHPSKHLSRETTTEIERQNINVNTDLAADIDRYLREIEKQNDTTNCLANHGEINESLRARMIDWMIEVLTNFKCDDQTFFLAVSLMDRYFKAVPQEKLLTELHITGVTSMFVASKFEDIYPLKMKTVYEKIAHQKIEISAIKALELDIMKVIQYKIHAPTVLDFLKVFLVQVLKIEIKNRTETKLKE
jgi:hypothetical protein